MTPLSEQNDRSAYIKPRPRHWWNPAMTWESDWRVGFDRQVERFQPAVRSFRIGRLALNWWNGGER